MKENEIIKINGLTHLSILAILVIVYNLFFIHKAFHIDDIFTIKLATAINEDFLKVPSFSNPILIGYYYAPIIRFFGEKEALFHFFYLPFTILSVIAMYFLSSRFFNKNLLPTISLVVSPAFLITSHSIMLDMPLLGFFLSALVLFIYGTDKNDARLLFLSGVLAGLAILIKYSGLLLIPLMLTYALLSPKRKPYLFLLIPILVFFAWGIFNAVTFKKFAFFQALLSRATLWSFDTILTRAFACLSFITATSIISLFLVPFLLRNKNNLFLFLFSLPIGTIPYVMKGNFSEYSYVEKTALALFFSCSFFIISILFKPILAYIVKKGINKDRLFLSIWFFSFLFCTIMIQFIAARFILLLFPPMFLLLYHELHNQKAHSLPYSRRYVMYALLCTLLISTIFAVGDYHFAGIYRDIFDVLRKTIPLDRELYFCPVSYSSYYSWGYAHYLNIFCPLSKNILVERKIESGMMSEFFSLLPNEQVLPMVIERLCRQESEMDYFSKILVTQITYEGNIFLHNRRHHAGFYSHDWGLLPFNLSFKKSPLESFGIYKLEKGQ